MANGIVIPLPIVISREGKWFVASCPLLDVATQGRTEDEVKANMHDLVVDYMQDPDTVKPELKVMMSASVSLLNVPVEVVNCGKAPSTASA